MMRGAPRRDRRDRRDRRSGPGYPPTVSSSPAAAAAALDVATVAARFADRPAADDDPTGEPWMAATALVLAPGEHGLAAAFIQRSERRGDRWSGQMALPGGRHDPHDPDLAATAAREAAEEVGLRLGAPIGRLPDQRGRGSKGLVATFVHVLDEQPPLVPQPSEVAAADWIDLAWLFEPANATRTRWVGVPFPGIAHRDRVIWGLTHRILADFADVLDLRLPRP